MTPDPDLYGPPEYEPDDPGQDDDWETLIEFARWQHTQAGVWAEEQRAWMLEADDG